MSIHYAYNYGGDSLAHNNHVGINLISDGKILAMRWDHKAYVMPGFDVTNMTHYTDTIGATLLGARYPAKVDTGPHIEVSLTSRGPVEVIPASQLDTLFLNANDLSVDELLQLAYRKIDKRAEEENG